VNRLISSLKKNGFDISSELGALKLNFLISQLIIMALLVANTNFLEGTVSSVVLKQLVLLGLVVMLIVGCYSIGYRSK
jgi:phosphoglycerol transferase MdoB-like AlkP superfamily enzyme